MLRSSSRIARSPFHGSIPAKPTNRSGFACAGRGQGVVRVRLDAGRGLGIRAEQDAHQPEAPEPLGHRIVALGEDGASEEALVILGLASPGASDPRIARVDVEVDAAKLHARQYSERVRGERVTTAFRLARRIL